MREREHGTMDHLLVMPLSPFEIAMSKIWANGLVIVVAVGLSLYGVARGLLAIPIDGSVRLFLCGVAIYLFFCDRGGFAARHGRTIDAAAGAALSACLPTPGHALRQQYAARKHAVLARSGAASVTDGAFCLVCAGDPLSRRRLCRGLAAISGDRSDRGAGPSAGALALPYCDGGKSDVRQGVVGDRLCLANTARGPAKESEKFVELCRLFEDGEGTPGQRTPADKVI